MIYSRCLLLNHHSVLEYSCEMWHPDLTKQQSATIEHLQKQVLLIAYPDLGDKEALEVAGLNRSEQIVLKTHQ